MPIQVVWTDTALNELLAIKTCIENDFRPQAATQVTEQIFQATDRLAEHPESGRIIPELNHPARRELIVSSYRVMYRLGELFAEIMHVVHVRRRIRKKDFKDLLT